MKFFKKHLGWFRLWLILFLLLEIHVHFEGGILSSLQTLFCSEQKCALSTISLKRFLIELSNEFQNSKGDPLSIHILVVVGSLMWLRYLYILGEIGKAPPDQVDD